MTPFYIGAEVGESNDHDTRGVIVDSHPDRGWLVWWCSAEVATWRKAGELWLRREAWYGRTNRWDPGSLADDVSRLIHALPAEQHEAARTYCNRIWDLERDRDTWRATAAGNEAAALRATRTERARCIAIARGCVDYSGGHADKMLEAYHHGMDTVVNVLSAPAGDRQAAVVEAIGRGAFDLGSCDRCGKPLPSGSEDPASGIILCPGGCQS